MKRTLYFAAPKWLQSKARNRCLSVEDFELSDVSKCSGMRPKAGESACVVVLRSFNRFKLLGLVFA